jgi:hypothetical protein
MKKLIEFQEDKHGSIIEVVENYRTENNLTFSEAVRRLILLSQNGHSCPEPEPIIYTTEDKRIDELEQKVDFLIKISKTFKKFMEGNSHG